MHSIPQLTFFTELEPQALMDLFADAGVTSTLKRLNAAVSVGLLDLSAERAKAIRQLNREGIPVTAWLLLPKSDGYWFNLNNFPQAADFYQAFKAWAAAENLRFSWIGLDIEPDINEPYDITRPTPGSLRAYLKRLLRPSPYWQVRAAYAALVARIRADGWPVEAYHAPLIADDLKARSTVLQRALGLIHFPVERTVLMLYSSFLRQLGPDFLQVYLPDTDSVGVGNTGGGVDIPDEPAYLNWEEFSRDLLLAHNAGKTMHIFSLEGCVRQGFLERLPEFDWNQPVVVPPATRLRLGRGLLQALLWLLQRPWVLVLAASALVLLPRRKPCA